MKIVLKIIAFLTVNIIGFFTTALAFHMAQLQGRFSETVDPIIIASFFQNAMFAWAAGAVISIGFFVINGMLRFIFLLAPIIAVIGYSLKFLLLSP